MLHWSDFQVAKSLHKEYEQIARQQWMLKQAFATSREARVFSRHIEQWLHNLKRIFSQSQHEQGFDCCGA